MTCLGVDACRGGWFATELSEDNVDTCLYESFDEFWSAHSTADRILVDIPIGLAADCRRRCDVDARELLGCRGLSVFYAPCADTIGEEDYDEANRIHKEQTDRGLSRQAHSILPKIEEVQTVLDRNPAARETVFESHPELCFLSLNGQPIAYPKSSERGNEFRRSLLEDVIPGVQRVYEEVVEDTYRKDVARDDILDSMVLAVAASNDSLSIVPEEPETDEPRMYYPGETG